MTSSISLKSFSEAGEILGVSAFTIRRLVNAGEIHSVNIGARVLISESEIYRVASQGAGIPRSRRVHKSEPAATR